MKQHKAHHFKQTGYTLIELLLYVTIVGSLLVSVSLFFGTVTDSRVKNQAVSEVDEQGAALMDYITQTIRNGTSITTPATAGAVNPSLTLVVPTSSLSPTIFDTSGAVMGYLNDGGTTGSAHSNVMNATKFTAGTTGTVKMLYAYLGPTVAASPNNQGQMAIYSGAGSPSTLLASSTSTTLTANAWNAFVLSTPASVTSGQVYWLAYNTNGLAAGDNDMRYHAGTAGQEVFVAQTFGTWPSSWTGTSQSVEFSTYAPILVSGSPSVARVKEGAGANVSLTSSDVEVTGLSFKNLTRSGTSGIVQVRFNIARVNPQNRPEYDYQKTFIGTAEVGW